MSESRVESHSTHPEVTLVVPSYNHAHYLAECLESLQQQTWPNWKAIVVDDFSGDFQALGDVVEKLGDDRVRVVRHERNRGLGAARNTGIRESTSDFVLPLDADDKLDSRAVELLVSALLDDETFDCAYGDVLLFGRRSGVIVFPAPAPNERVTGPENTIPGAGTMMRKSFWERMGGYDEADELRHGREDFEFWIRAFDDGCRAKRVPEPTYHYRQSHTSMNLACRLEDHNVTQYIYDKHKDVFSSPGDAKRFLGSGYRTASEASYQKGQQRRALELAYKAWRIQPSKSHLRNVVRSMVRPASSQKIREGGLRRMVPFLGYPLHGDARYGPFFIIGVARSGNTLLRRILTSHSLLHIPPETFVLGECLRKFRRYGSKMTWPDLVQLILAQFEMHHEYHTIDLWLGPAVARLVQVHRNHRNLATILNSFYRYHAEENGKPHARWGDKTPLNSLDPGTLEGLAKVFPDAQFLHIYRDACDVVYSHLSGGFMRTVEEASERWLSVMRNTRDFVGRHSERCHELRYEDLLTMPEKTVRGICDFMRIPFEGQMVGSESSAEGLGDVPAWYWHNQVNDPINSKNMGKGRSFFSEREREIIQSILGAELTSLGYPPASA